MTGVHLFMAWLDTALLSSMIVLWFGSRFKLGSVYLRIGVAIVALGVFIPVHGLSLFMYVRAVIGDLSFTSKAFLFAWLLYRLDGPVITDMKEIRFVLSATAIIGLLFYPLSLGLSSFDPYSIGYSARILIVWTFIAAAYGIRNGYYILAAAMVLALWGYLLGLMESNNLFDYLLDPLLFLYAAGFTCVTLLRNLKANNSAGRIS
jgi:hypothetical protein